MIFTLMMALNPEVAEKVHNEIDQAIGRGRIPNPGDRESLPYFDAALQEALRIAPPVPLGESCLLCYIFRVQGQWSCRIKPLCQ